MTKLRMPPMPFLLRKRGKGFIVDRDTRIKPEPILMEGEFELMMIDNVPIGANKVIHSKPGDDVLFVMHSSGKFFYEEVIGESVALLELKAKQGVEEVDPTPWCIGCSAMTQDECDCGPIAENN